MPFRALAVGVTVACVNHYFDHDHKEAAREGQSTMVLLKERGVLHLQPTDGAPPREVPTKVYVCRVCNLDRYRMALDFGWLVQAVTSMTLSCASAPGWMPSALDNQAYEEAELACVADAGSRADADRCRGAARSAYCQRFPSLAFCKPEE